MNILVNFFCWLGRYSIRQIRAIGRLALFSYHVFRNIPGALSRFYLIAQQTHFIGNYSLSIISVSGLFVGAGVNFALTDNWALRLGYDRYFDVIDAEDVDMDLDYAYLTLGYVFGDRTPAPVAPQPVTKTVTTSYNLDASALFGFDSATLTEEGHAAVSQVVVDAQNANLDFVAYDVKGYTDPIGNAEYNKGLSLRRAQAVSAELQAKGVPAGAITVAGLGATESTVGDACDGLPRNEKLKCYAPDRRVVVNVTGSTTTTEQQ